MKNVLVLGEFDATMLSAISHDKALSEYQFEFYNEMYPSDTDQGADILEKVHTAIKRNDVIFFTKQYSEICLKITLAAMEVCNKKHLIVLQYYNWIEKIAPPRLQSILRVSSINFCLIQFKNSQLSDRIHINVIQNKNVYKNLKLHKDDFKNLIEMLLKNVGVSLDFLNDE